MALLTDLSRVQAVAADDANVQALTGAESLVTQVLAYVEKMAPESRFGGLTEAAQTYLAAHLLSMAFQPVGGRGPLSSESVGGVSISYTLPYLNRTTVLGATQFGLMYLDLVRKTTVALGVVIAAE